MLTRKTQNNIQIYLVIIAIGGRVRFVILTYTDHCNVNFEYLLGFSFLMYNQLSISISISIQFYFVSI